MAVQDSGVTRWYWCHKNRVWSRKPCKHARCTGGAEITALRNREDGAPPPRT